MPRIIFWVIFSLSIIQTSHATELKRGFAWPIVVGELDPHNNSSDTLYSLITHYLEPLLKLTPGGSITRGLAERWEVNDDATEVVLHLDVEAVWASGIPITARQIKASIERALSPHAKSDAQQLLLPIQGAQQRLSGEVQHPLGIEVIDDHTVRFKLIGSQPDFLKVLTFPITSPVPMHQIGADLSYPDLTVLDSSGPYRLVKREKHTAHFVKNENYFAPWPGHFSEVSFTFGEYKTLVRSFMDQSLDLLEYIPATQLSWLRKNMAENLIAYSSSSGAVYLVAKSDSLGGVDATLRRLLMRSVDVRRVRNLVNKGLFPIISDIIPWVKNEISYRDNETEEYLKQGRLLLEKRGYSAGKRLTLCIHTRKSAVNRVITNLLQATWKAMHVELTVKEVSSLLDVDATQKDMAPCEFAFGGFTSRVRSEEEVVLAFGGKGGLFSSWLMDDAELNPLFKNLLNSTQLVKRNEMTYEIADKLEKSSLVTPLYQDGMISLVHHERVGNYSSVGTNWFIPLSEYLRP